MIYFVNEQGEEITCAHTEISPSIGDSIEFNEDPGLYKVNKVLHIIRNNRMKTVVIVNKCIVEHVMSTGEKG